MDGVLGCEERGAGGGLRDGGLQAAVAAQDVFVGHFQAGTMDAGEEFAALFGIDQDGADSAVVVEPGAEVADAPEVADGQVAAAAELPGGAAVAARAGIEVGQESPDEQVLRLAFFAQYGAAEGSRGVRGAEEYLEIVAFPSGAAFLLVAEADFFYAHITVALSLEGGLFLREVPSPYPRRRRSVADEIHRQQSVCRDSPCSGGKKMVEARHLAGGTGEQHRTSLAQSRPDPPTAVLHPALQVFGTDECRRFRRGGGTVVDRLMDIVIAGAEDYASLFQYGGGQQGECPSRGAAVPYRSVRVLHGVDLERPAGGELRDDGADPRADAAFDAGALIHGGIEEAFGIVLHGDAASGAGRRAGGAAAAVVRVGDDDVSYFSHKRLQSL